MNQNEQKAVLSHIAECLSQFNNELIVVEVSDGTSWHLPVLSIEYNESDSLTAALGQNINRPDQVVHLNGDGVCGQPSFMINVPLVDPDCLDRCKSIIVKWIEDCQNHDEWCRDHGYGEWPEDDHAA